MSWIEKHGFSLFGSFNLSLLGIDEAWLNVTNSANQDLWLYQLSTDCQECPYKLRLDVDSSPNASTIFKISTKYPFKYRFRTEASKECVLQSDHEDTFCETEISLGEFGVYDLVAEDSTKCQLVTQLKPVNIYLPILIAVIFYTLLIIAILLWKKYGKVIQAKIPPRFRRYIDNLLGPASGSNSVKSVTQTPVPQPTKERLRSLDTFRGLCIIIMIFVNDGGAQYLFMEHATWDGLYIADLVFPWFLWIMGVCIPVSIKSQLRRKVPKLTILKGIIIRSLKLIGIGLILASKRGPVDIQTFRLPGILQRFGLCYFVSAASVLVCGSDELVCNKISTNKWIASVQDIIFVWKGWLISIAILAVHTTLTFLLPVPGCPTGYLGPGGLHLFKEINSYPNASKCIGGASGYIDREILQTKHIFKFPTALYTYEAEPYDPEGILGTLTSVFQVWLGVQAGMTLQVYPKHMDRLLRWLIWAIVTGGIGAALCGGQQFGGLIPVNKNLWSLSFVLVTSSFALILLIGLYIIIDIKKWWTGTPFFEPGMNSILLYVGHSVGYVMLPFHFNYKDELNTHFLRLVESLWGTSLWVLIGIYLFRVKYFWTL